MNNQLKALDKLSALRRAMDKAGVNAVIVPNADPHQSEYLAGHWQALKWLTGFTGSAGTAVVTKNQAFMWTDFRYWIQAASQLDGFDLCRQGDKDVPFFDKWLAKTLPAGAIVSLDGKMVSASQVKGLKKLFEPGGIILDTSQDLISDLWQDRPEMPLTQAFELDPVYAGQTRAQKFDRIREKMAGFKADWHLMAALDDIAWTFNLRGADIHTNPVNIAFAMIGMGNARLYIDPAKLSDTLSKALEADGISLIPYAQFYADLNNFASDNTILLDPEKVSDFVYDQAGKEAKVIEVENFAQGFKCVKNNVEISHIRDTAVKDGRAVVNFLHWLCASRDPKTEISAANRLLGCRKAQEEFIHPSFDSIMAFREHSAICHYSATPETDLPITPDAMFLTDSGGNYLTGTTDITRTVHLGKPSQQEIQDYTLVLKAHIAVATARFPSTARGYQIDAMARRLLWQQGMDFGHGTGHGVGFFLCVHEGPARLSTMPVDQVLKPGMLLTNEPGLYREGQYGIRLENQILVVEDTETEFGRFLKFENMTFCHFERNLIDNTLLSQEELLWLNNYHQTVFNKLTPGLNSEIRTWLERKTRKL